MKITIAGTGYVGLVTAVCIASTGYKVTCLEVNEEKIRMLQSGKTPIYEPGLEELMEQSKENLTYTCNAKEAYSKADVIFISVGTPEKKDGSANVSYVYEVARQIAEFVDKECVVVVKSTVPIGTNDKIEKFLKNNLKNNVPLYIASNPEFLAQGTAVRDTLYANRIVIGCDSEVAENRLKEVYRGFHAPILVTDRRSAEMIKYASNDFLALKISYVNEVANLCELVGANIEDVAKGVGMDTRIGNQFLRAGIGYGGSCFPKDTKALYWLGNSYDQELKTVKAAIEVNEQQKLKLFKKAKKYYESLSNKKVAVLGLTFKPETDDLREAPSLVNIPMLLDDGAEVSVWDPIGIEKFKESLEHIACEGREKIQYCMTPAEALKEADICFIFTEWKQVKTLLPEEFLIMKKPIILDGRNCFTLEKMEQYPLIYESIGRKIVKNLSID